LGREGHKGLCPSTTPPSPPANRRQISRCIWLLPGSRRNGSVQQYCAGCWAVCDIVRDVECHPAGGMAAMVRRRRCVPVLACLHGILKCAASINALNVQAGIGTGYWPWRFCEYPSACSLLAR